MPENGRSDFPTYSIQHLEHVLHIIHAMYNVHCVYTSPQQDTDLRNLGHRLELSSKASLTASLSRWPIMFLKAKLDYYNLKTK